MDERDRQKQNAIVHTCPDALQQGLPQRSPSGSFGIVKAKTVTTISSAIENLYG
ncbi:MAG: hypothetical protein HC824_02290 [Synechococcales cyanobacterium RM1_1_8]|nr:hypothetical protein [Synechococcales cyanobacterium RM1_1_8]